jgi:hypothetical protein
MQEMSTAGAARSADQDLHPEQPVYGHGPAMAANFCNGNRLSHSYTESLPDFVKLAEAYGASVCAPSIPPIWTARSRR